MAKSNGYLLDTQIFIWWMEGGSRLPAKIKSILQDPKQNVSVSVASVWEMISKQQKGKLKTPYDIEGGIRAAGFRLLSIEIAHVLEVRVLPFYHKDPFDRLLIAQARAENFTFVTADAKIRQYSLSLLKA